MKFECQESCGGKCCSLDWKGRNSFVFLTKGDQHRLVMYLRASLYKFASYGEFVSTRFAAKPTRQHYLTPHKGRCPFLKDGKCGVYEARPTQCRTFPYWAENAEQGEWTAGVKDSCPGIGKGNERESHSLWVEQRKADEELRGNAI